MKDIGARVAEVESGYATINAQINSLFALVNDIREQMRVMAENQRPNLNALFIAMLALFSFVATIGVLAFSPVYKNLTRLEAENVRQTEALTQIQATRFTPFNGDQLRNELRADLKKGDAALSERIYRNEAVIFNVQERVSKLEGKNE